MFFLLTLEYKIEEVEGGVGIKGGRGWKILENLIVGMGRRKFSLLRQNRLHRS